MKTLYWMAVALVATMGFGQTSKQDEYLKLTEQTLLHPVVAAELESAFLDPRGVALVRELFEQSMKDGLWSAGGQLVTPEFGGEATLNQGELSLVRYPDPVHPLIRKVHTLRAEPRALLDFLNESYDGKRILKKTGGLHALLYQLTQDDASEMPQGLGTLLNQIVDTTIEIHFKTWTADPLIQRMMIEQNEWKGRYAGFWHIHPPRTQGAGFADGIEPSNADLEAANQLGRFLTIVFQPEGFDVYDLSAANASKSVLDHRVAKFRSPDWVYDFRRLLAELRP